MAATTNQPSINPYAHMPISEVVQIFNALPQPETTNVVQSLYHWHLSLISNDHAGAFVLFKIGSPTRDYKCVISNHELKYDIPKGAKHIAAAILRCMLHNFQSSGIKPWFWTTDNARLGAHVARAMRLLGVELSKMPLGEKSDNDEGLRRWGQFQTDYPLVLENLGLSVNH
jgi:hypothetical protein